MNVQICDTIKAEWDIPAVQGDVSNSSPELTSNNGDAKKRSHYILVFILNKTMTKGYLEGLVPVFFLGPPNNSHLSWEC